MEQAKLEDVTVRVRPAVAKDSEAIVASIRGAYAEYRDRLTPPSGAHAESLESVNGLLLRGSAFVAEASNDEIGVGEVVGCVFHELRRGGAGEAPEVYLHRLGVRPEWRRRGIGEALVAAVEDAALKQGASRVTLGCRIRLPENRRFYQRLGYRIVSAAAHPGYAEPTYWVMNKRVGAAAQREVVVCPWSPFWADEYELAARDVRRILGDDVIAVHHIGSTAVEGMAAKPTIDLMAVVHCVEQAEQHDLWFVLAGWQPWGEHGTPGRRFYRRGSDVKHTHHLHIFGIGHPEIEHQLATVAYLRSHEAEARQYGELKLALAQAHPYDIDAYAAGKAEHVQELKARAVAWQRLANR
jgi:GrpB-like predicted nucleotidyltransferase (UPF0157 family)/GNAT superfamily N-acetyltransferase